MSRIQDSQLTQILSMLTELKASVNALATDFYRHDHTAANEWSIRINTAVASLVYGTKTASPVTGSAPGLAALYDVP